MKTITSYLAILAVGTTVALAADEKNPTSIDKPTAAGEQAAKPGAATSAVSPTAASSTASSAAAAEKPKRDPAEMFKKLDANSDGKVSADEWKSSPMAKKDMTKAEETFMKKDKDGDKSLTMEEFTAKGKKNK